MVKICTTKKFGNNKTIPPAAHVTTGSLESARLNRRNDGFTLMEIVVATTIFAMVSVALTRLFNYTLKINRRAEALRQATQGMRNFVEYLAKEVRNGQIDYSVNTNHKVVDAIYPCPHPNNVSLPVGSDNRNDRGDIYGQTDTTLKADNRLGIITSDGSRECIYLATDSIGTPATSTLGSQVFVKKNTLPAESINPPNFTIDSLTILVRPVVDPYTITPSPPRIQPFVTMYLKATATLGTGERVPIYYQTSVSSDKYDIPN